MIRIKLPIQPHNKAKEQKQDNAYARRYDTVPRKAAVELARLGLGIAKTWWILGVQLASSRALRMAKRALW